KGKCSDSFYVGGDQVNTQGCLVKIPNLGWLKMAESIKYGGHIPVPLQDAGFQWELKAI
ncbi:hypothetical protein ND16A_0119, partial [Thalassotalea sp. ND16A]